MRAKFRANEINRLKWQMRITTEYYAMKLSDD